MASTTVAGGFFLSDHLPRLTVVIPCRDEAPFIEGALRSVLESDYPASLLDVIVVDGMSTDGTREILSRFASEHESVRVLDNVERSIPHALNIGIRAATGELVARLDAHASLHPGYLRGCVEALEERQVSRVGGRIETIPQNSTPFGRAVAAVLASRVGVGGSQFRTATGGGPIEVDTVPFWVATRKALEDVGPYDARLARSEDIEHSLRMKRKGHKTLLVPDLSGAYYSRSSWRGFASHAFVNGAWAVLPFRLVEGVPVSARHLVPLAFVVALAALGAGAAFSPLALVGFVALAGCYLGLSLGAGIVLAAKRRDIALAFLAPVALATLHVAYGLGSLRGLLGRLP